MGTIGGPYPLYAVDDAWTAGHSYSPGALVLWNGTMYLARDYLTNSQTSPDADTDNWLVYAPIVPTPSAVAPTVQQVFNGTTLPATPAADVVALFMQNGIGLLPNADQVPGQRVWVAANTSGLDTTLHTSDQEHGFNLNGFTYTSLAFAGGHGLLLAVGTMWLVVGGSPTGGYY